MSLFVKGFHFLEFTSCEIIYSFSGTVFGLCGFRFSFAFPFLSGRQHLSVSFYGPSTWYLDQAAKTHMILPVGIARMSRVMRQAEFVTFLKVGPPEVFPGLVIISALVHSDDTHVPLGLPPTARKALFISQVHMEGEIASTHETHNRKCTR